MRRLVALALAVVLSWGAVLGLAGCSSKDPSGPESGGAGGVGDITVTAGKTRAPSLAWPDGMTFPTAGSTVLWPGEGAELIDGQPLLLDLYIQSLDTGEVLQNTYDGLPRSFLLAPELLGNDIYTALRDQRVGARILAVAPPTEGFAEETSIAIVIDVLSDRAVGTSVHGRNDLPIVINKPTGEPQITLRDDDELPKELTVQTLIRGEGEQVQKGSYIVAQYKIVYGSSGASSEGAWIPGELFDSTWDVAKEAYEVQVGVGETLPALDEGLIDQTAGSQVMIIAPETLAYPGKGTLIFVIDILDVWTPDA